jgi:hypothetical protein
MTVMLRDADVECILPHVFAGTGGHKLDGFEPSGRGPQPKTSAFLMTCYWLNGATPIGHRVIGDKTFVYAWKRLDGSTLAFAWCTEGSTVDFHSPEPWRITNVFGQRVVTSSLGPEPILIWADEKTAPELTLEAAVAMIRQ